MQVMASATMENEWGELSLHLFDFLQIISLIPIQHHFSMGRENTILHMKRFETIITSRLYTFTWVRHSHGGERGEIEFIASVTSST